MENFQAILQNRLVDVIINAIIVLIITHHYGRKKKNDRYYTLEELKKDMEDITNTFICLIIGPLFFLCYSWNRWGWIEEGKFGRIYIIALVVSEAVIKYIVSKLEDKYKLKLNMFKRILAFYIEDEETGRYFLEDKQKWTVKAITMCKILYFSAFSLLYDPIEYLQKGAAIASFPVFILFFLAELDLCMSGRTKDEFMRRDSNGVAELENKKIPLIVISDDVIRQLHQFKLKVKIKLEKRSELKRGGQRELEDYEYELLQGFLEKRNYEERKLKYLTDPTVRILQKQNVVFNTYFYRDLDFAVFYPMMLAVFKGKKALVVVQTEEIEKEIRWITEKMEEMCGIHELIRCNSLQNAKDQDDIILLDYQEFEKWKDNTYIVRYRARIDMLFLIEPSASTTYELEEISNIQNEIRELGGMMNVVIADSHREIMDRIMSVADSKTIYKGPYVIWPEQYAVIWWDADGEGGAEFESDKIEVNIIHMVKCKVEQGEIVWINRGKRASVDLWWNYKKYSGELGGITLHHVEDGRVLESKKEAYYIIEDDEYNCGEIVEQFLSRIQEKGFICVVSPNYMLRNYILKNEEAKKILKEFVGGKLLCEIPQTERNMVLYLLKKLYADKDIKTANISKELTNARGEVWEKTYFFEIVQKYLGINLLEDGKGEKYAIEEKEVSIYQSEKEVKNWSGVNYHNFYQKYLPGQSVAIRGMRYEIIDIKEKDGSYRERVGRNLDYSGKREYYRQIRRYMLSDIEEGESGYVCRFGKANNIEISYLRANVFCETEGYYVLPRFNDFYHGKLVKVKNIPNREHCSKKIMKISLPEIDLKGQIYLTIILKEIMYTLCPDHVDYLGICLHHADDEIYQEFLKKGILWQVDGVSLEEAEIYLIEDSVWDLGLLQVIEQKMSSILQLCLSYITWYIAGEDEYLLFGSETDGRNIKEELQRLKNYLEGKVEKKQVNKEVEKVTEPAIETSEIIDTESLEEVSEKQTKDQPEKENLVKTKEQDENDREIKEIQRKITTKKEGREIFEEVLFDMFYFRDLNVNIVLNPVFRKKIIKKEVIKSNNTQDISDKEKKKRTRSERKEGYVYLNLDEEYRQFYWQCAYGIINEYSLMTGKGIGKDECEKYATDYVELLFSNND